MKVSFTTLGCPGWSLDQIALNARAFGYDGVELRTHTDGNHFSPDASPHEARRVADLFRDHGTPVTSIMGYSRFAFSDENEIKKNQELLSKLILLAETMQAPWVRSFAGKIPEGADRAALIAKMAQVLKPLADVAADKGVTIAFETHDDWCAGAAVMQLLDAVDSKGVGIVYDIFNSFHSGLEPWETTYRTVRERICYCHLKDAYLGRDGKHHYVLLGAGDLPVAAIFARLKAGGYDGFFSFEWEKKWHPELEEPERAFPQFPRKVRALWEAAGAKASPAVPRPRPAPRKTVKGKPKPASNKKPSKRK